MIKHAKIYKEICNKFSLHSFKGKGGYTPKNYTVFLDEKNNDIFQIEYIPAGKYMKTLYVMFIENNEVKNKEIAESLKSLYLNATKGQGVSFCMDFNNNEPGLLF